MRKVSQQTLMGFAYEYLVASALVGSTPEARWEVTERQQTAQEHRYGYYLTLKEMNPRKADYLEKAAFASISHLPECVGAVSFVEVSANGGSVYDVYYESEENKIVQVSCKTTSTEDKAYRFSTVGYTIPATKEILQKVFKKEDAGELTYNESLAKHNMTVKSLQDKMTKSIITELKDTSSDTYRIFQKLLKEKFIGTGGYYKTTANKGVSFYPELSENHQISIKPESLTRTTTTVKFRCEQVDENSNKVQEYQISFRIKFKDGVNKILSLTDEGLPRNIAATVKTQLI